MARLIQEEMSSYHTYASAATTSVDLPEYGYITDLHCTLVANITATGTEVARTDGLINLIGSMKIEAAGQQYFNATGPEDLFYMSYFQHRGALRLDSLPDDTTSDLYADFKIHLGYYPKEPMDPSVVIPGRRVSNLKNSVVWGTAASLGTGYTVNSAYLYVTPSQIVLEEGESEADVWPEVLPDGSRTGRSALLVPRVENSSQSLTSANSSLSLSHDVPTNMVLHRTLITVLDSNGDRTNTPVTEIGVKFPPQTLQPVKFGWMRAVGINRARTETPADVAGEFLIEWPLISGDPCGLDLTNAQKGDVTIVATNTAATGSTIRYLHVGYLRPAAG